VLDVGVLREVMARVTKHARTVSVDHFSHCFFLHPTISSYCTGSQSWFGFCVDLRVFLAGLREETPDLVILEVLEVPRNPLRPSVRSKGALGFVAVALVASASVSAARIFAILAAVARCAAFVAIASASSV
jgi:hypothetical protein